MNDLPRWPWMFKCNLVRLIDADTVALRLDLGFRVYSEQTIRLWGVSCPELNTEAGRTALLWARHWFDEHMHIAGERWPFCCETDKEKQTFARWIGRITCVENHSLGDALVQAGHGVIA